MSEIAELREALLRAEREVESLRAALASSEALLRQTRDALFRDAGQVVRALGELERRDAAMNAELHRALRFQRAMIEPLPVDDRVSLDAIYLAADVISADFYDVAFLGEDHLRIFVADATGHGIAAGLATMFVKAEYAAHKRSCPTPASLVGAINDVLTSRYETLDLRCTAICVDVHPTARRLSFSSAAHPGPMIARTGVIDHLPGSGAYIGLRASIEFPSVETTLEPGDLVIAFTDGLLDASDVAGKVFGIDRVTALARSARASSREAGRGEPVNGLARALVNELSAFVGEGQTLLDDVTVVALALRT
jgi:two-component system, sensor histidine kinase LadS